MKLTPGLKQCYVTGLRRRFYPMQETERQWENRQIFNTDFAALIIDLKMLYKI